MSNPAINQTPESTDRTTKVALAKDMENTKMTLAELIEKAASVTPEELEARRLEYTRTHPPVNVPLISEERLKELGF